MLISVKGPGSQRWGWFGLTSTATQCCGERGKGTQMDGGQQLHKLILHLLSRPLFLFCFLPSALFHLPFNFMHHPICPPSTFPPPPLPRLTSPLSPFPSPPFSSLLSLCSSLLPFLPYPLLSLLSFPSPPSSPPSPTRCGPHTSRLLWRLSLPAGCAGECHPVRCRGNELLP